MKNKEIEELLNDMRYFYEIHKEIIKKFSNADKIHYPFPISLKQVNLLLSSIEQLEKGKEDMIQYACDLEDKICNLNGNIKQLENNRDKAIKKCQDKQYQTNHEWLKRFAKEIENILKGGSDE